MINANYGHFRSVEGKSFDEVLEKTRAALSEEGFGVLTEIDVRETMKKKLGVEFNNYKILGACNPPLAHQALTAEPAIGLLLPCNVVVSEENGSVSVGAISPKSMFKLVDNDQMASVAEEVEAKVLRVLDRIG
jgi:uncharacterized protein (DUF302 family)